MATPPTRVLSAQPATNWGTGTSKVTTAFDVQAGDIITVKCSVENAGSTSTVTPSASGGSVTWTSRAAQNTGGNTVGAAYCWTGVVGAAATGITVTLARPTTAALEWGFTAVLWRNHGGVGAVFSGNNGTGSGAPSISAVCSANSAVDIQINDWNAADGTTRTWRTINGAAETESTYYRNSLTYTVYGGRRDDVGAAGTITQGLTAPTGLRWVAVGVEILGTTGGPTTVAGTDSAALTDTSSPAPTLSASDSAALADVVAGVVAAAVTDAATVTEGATSVILTVATTDSATLADASSMVPTVAPTDTATLADASAAAPTLTRADTATVTDTGSVGGSGTQSAADTATLTDTSSAAPSLSTADTATAADTSAVTQQGTQPSVVDAATLTDTSSMVPTVARTDTGATTDTSSAAPTLTRTDTATAAETRALASTSTSADTAAATEQSGLLARLLALVDGTTLGELAHRVAITVDRQGWVRSWFGGGSVADTGPGRGASITPGPDTINRDGTV